ncbi:uncharacterized protein At4g33100 [Asparagus officinalis]|uniref:uncharacterized protein At4g33100 n=1 Tax=Asparagus officinalis TaxID=4686 RepID=UPI00098E3E7A|nr:uncharacterized protein At4g33100 [Asparagus officinalis]
MGLSSGSKTVSASACAQLRAAYHDCFNRWYSDKFLKGQWDKEECVAEWDKYRACLAQHLEDKHLRSILLGAEASGYTNTSDGFSSVDTDGDFRQ